MATVLEPRVSIRRSHSAVRLTANQKRALRRLWDGDLSIEEIAEDLSLASGEWLRDGENVEVVEFGVDAVMQAATSLGLGERPQIEVYVPTLSEIRAATALIRSKWTQREREERLKHAWLTPGRIEDATEGDNNAGRGPTSDRAEGGSPRAEARRRDRRG